MILEFPLALLAIPVVLGAAVFSFRRADRVAQVLGKANALWASPTRIGRSPNRGRVGFLRGLCLLAGSLFVVAALARPQWGTEEEVVFDQAREVVLALDLSQSMVAADVSPTRLERAKLLIESLLDELKGERVGLVVFSGTAFLQSPLSSDYEVLRDLLPELTPSYLPQGGTDYEAMLATALRSFHDADGKGDRFLVVLSDGEAHGEGFRRLVPTLKAKGVRVLGLGVGTQDGDVIPDGNGGLVKDVQGAVVLSRLESGTLRELATETGGTYRDAAGWVDINELVEATVAKGFEGEFVEGSDLRRQDRFQWSLAPGILLLLFAFWLELPAQPSARTVRQRAGGRAAWSRKAVPLVGLLLAVAMGPVSARAGDEPMRVAEPNPLEELVAELAGQQVRVAKDYAQLAEATIAYASSQPSLTASSREGVVGDALLGVAFGEEEDPFAADWDNLRARLEAAREPPVPPSPPESSSSEPDSPQSEQSQEPGSPESDAAGSKGQPGQEGASGQEASDGSASEDSEAQSGDSSGAGGESEAPSSSKASSADSSSEESEESEPGQAGPQNAETPAPDQEPATGGGGESMASKSQHEPEKNGSQAGEPDDLRALDAQDAGLGALAEQQEQPEPDPVEENVAAASSESGEPSRDEPPRASRPVGGGTGVSDLSGKHPELAASVSHMERIRKQDSPGVLFQRMNALENPTQTPDRNKEKNW